MTTNIEQIAAQIRQLNPVERQRLLTLIPDFGRMNTAPLNAATLQFNGQNISVAAYEALAEDEKFKFLDKAENGNTDWLREKFRTLRAAWIMVVDGNAAAFGESMDTYPNDDEFLKLCQKFGKYPFVFFNPLILAIEEPASAWHPTVLAVNDFYPARPITISGNAGSHLIEADFDTGAWEI